jgi:hypothetical protein
MGVTLPGRHRVAMWQWHKWLMLGQAQSAACMLIEATCASNMLSTGSCLASCSRQVAQLPACCLLRHGCTSCQAVAQQHTCTRSSGGQGI